MFGFLKRKKTRPDEELRSMLGEVKLPSFNVTVMSVLRMLRDPDGSMHDIADQLQVDPGMNVKVLRTVNSAAYGLASKIGNIHHAVSMLGCSRLESTILSVAVKDSLPDFSVKDINEARFWAVAEKRAGLAMALAKQLHPATKAEVYTAALLQDMAVPVMINSKKEAYCRVIEMWFADKSSKLNVLEQEAFGYDHAMIGGLMAEEWGLPQYLIDAISGHHDEGTDLKVDAAIRLVSFLRYDSDEGIALIKEKCVSEYGMDEQLAEQIVEESLRASESSV